MNEVFRVQRLSKTNEGKSLFNVNLNLFVGEIAGVIASEQAHAALLFSIITGQLQQDFGKIFVEDAQVAFSSEFAYRKRGIFSIKKQSQLISNMSVAENLLLGASTQKTHFFVNPRTYWREEIVAFLREYDLSLHDFPSHSFLLTNPERHIIEVLKAVFHGAKVIIIDNIFNGYIEKDYSNFASILRKITQKGVGILLFVNNSNSSLIPVTDRMHVLRKGTTVASVKREAYSRESLLALVSGGTANHHSAVTAWEENDREAFSLESVCTENHRPLHFSLHIGEVLGVYDPDWAYGPDMLQILNGNKSYQGTIKVRGKTYISNPQKGKGRFLGSTYVGVVPECDISQLLFQKMNLEQNVTLMVPDELCYPGGIIKPRVCRYLFEKAFADINSSDILEKYGKEVELPYLEPEVQIRVLVAKYLCAQVDVIAFFNPQNNFDDFDFQRLKQLFSDICRCGVSVLVFSSKLSPLYELCGRIVV